LVAKIVSALCRTNEEGELWSARNTLPNAGAELTPAPGTRPEFTSLKDHYRIDISTTPPTISKTNWRLRIIGLVENPLELTLDDVRNRYPPLDQFITLACISNPVAGDLTSTQRWTGVSLQRLLPDLRLRPEATHLKISSADGFFEIVSLETIRADERVMLTYAWDGVPLLTKHGFPLRIYIPNLYGMKQPKWIQSIEAIDHWEPGYWVERGWDREARMKATAVIDTVAVDMMITQANERTLIPIGGIAHAGARGISKVEVQADGGEWREARLREPLSGLTWVIWRYDWPFQPGSHNFMVRCYDGSGDVQVAEESAPHPNGASGLHSKSIRL
jgi:DMSO/TMAO reductase YedYZ molybdopterin-dependent catalytic subunit